MSPPNPNQLNGQVFFAKLLTQYALIHEKIIGSAAEEYIRQLGLRTGEWLEGYYSKKNEQWTVEKYVDVLIDISHKINGQFEIDTIESDYIVVKANKDPFGELVNDSPHLWAITSSVFGGIAARRLGYGKVDLRQKMVNGDPVFEVAVYFNEDDELPGDEYKEIPVTPENGDPFHWEEETIKMLGEELRRSDEMIESLVSELEDLRAQVKNQS